MLYGVMFHHFHQDGSALAAPGSMTEAQFDGLLDYLEDNYTIITPSEYIEKQNSNTLEPTDVCLTFDDALKGQYDIALPVMERRNLKAFFFVYSGAFSQDPPEFEFHRDFRVSCFKDTDQFYDVFFQVVQDQHKDKYEQYLQSFPEDYLTEFPFYTLGDRQYRYIRDNVLGETYFDIISEMMKKMNYSIAERNPYLFMTTDNLKELHDKGHMLGLHSHTHPTRIEELSHDEQLEEFTINFKFLTDIVKGPIRSMSHPCGRYNDDTLSILKNFGIEIGFRSSLTPKHIASSFEVPREDHSNILSLLRQAAS